MDARWYNPKVGRFIQPDQYNHVNLMLPKGAQSELMRYIGRSQSDLLKDPAQQMRYGYVSGNALRWVDPLGLCYPEDAGYVGLVGNGVQVVDPSNMYANPGSYVQPSYFSDDSNLIFGYSPESDTQIIIPVVGTLIDILAIVATELTDNKLPSGTTLGGYVDIGAEITKQAYYEEYDSAATFGTATGFAAGALTLGIGAAVVGPSVGVTAVSIGVGYAANWAGSKAYNYLTADY
ncbi:hypothetical protein KO489_05370 [Reinekea forsetii]|nr:hypothetical protein [Reinekea forsetii]